jgi:hypothetical protein
VIEVRREATMRKMGMVRRGLMERRRKEAKGEMVE